MRYPSRASCGIYGSAPNLTPHYDVDFETDALVVEA